LFKGLFIMELKQLISFHQIIKTGSFSKAAGKVFRTQSALSHQIKNLEEELKVKLFEKHGKMILLTWEGKCLFDFITRFLDDMDNLKQIYEDVQRGTRGTLIIATSNAVCTYCLTDTIKRFIHQAPNIKFKLIASTNMADVQSMILDGTAHLGIGARYHPILSNKLDFFYWKSFDRLLIVNKGHPLCRKKTVTIHDIADYPLILYKEGSMLRKDVEESLNRNNLPYEIVIEMDDADNLKKFVDMGIGISILSSLTITNEDKKKFVIFNVNNLFNTIEYGIYCRKDEFITSSARNFIKIFAPDVFNDEYSPNPDSFLPVTGMQNGDTGSMNQ
jgi:LysR family transcriptional regulator, cys regulon transcriptional activator